LERGFLEQNRSPKEKCHLDWVAFLFGAGFVADCLKRAAGILLEGQLEGELGLAAGVRSVQ
jgi:hypothetical protein